MSGTPTVNGTYSFTVRANDPSSSQSATAPEQIVVVDRIAITSSATSPDACQNQPYSFTVQTSGGAPPVTFGFISGAWPTINMTSSGVFTGTPTVLGTFTGTVSATDLTGTVSATDLTGTMSTALQSVSSTVKTCP